MAEGADGPRRIQMNVRLPEDLVAEVDARRAEVDRTGISRDKWVERVIRWALDQPPRRRTPTAQTVARTPLGRTAATRRNLP